MSKQRELILDIIHRCDGHISAQELYKRASAQMPHISVGTVYRNLGKLCEEKLIREVPVTNGAAVYELMQVPHGHLVCESCGSVSDFPIENIEQLQVKLGCKILSCSFCVTHICKECSTKKF